jgi:hypothetical protein
MARLFGDRPVQVSAVVREPVSRAFARKARLAFFVVTAVCVVVAAVVASAFVPVLLAVLLAVLVGPVVGLAVAVLVRAWPVLRVLWWWSLEITIAAVVLTGVSVLARVTHPLIALGVLAAVVLWLWLIGPARRWLSAWSWCVVVRHRLRSCFAEFIRAAGSEQGGLPLLLWARPTPAGERVWLWLRSGLELSDLDGKTGKLAVACWAGEVRVVRASARFAALIRVDVTRRDPLTGVVASPLAVLFASYEPDASAALLSSAVPLGGLDLADVPEPPVEVRNGRR